MKKPKKVYEHYEFANHEDRARFITQLAALLPGWRAVTTQHVSDIARTNALVLGDVYPTLIGSTAIVRRRKGAGHWYLMLYVVGTGHKIDVPHDPARDCYTEDKCLPIGGRYRAATSNRTKQYGVAVPSGARVDVAAVAAKLAQKIEDTAGQVDKDRRDSVAADAAVAARKRAVDEAVALCGLEPRRDNYGRAQLAIPGVDWLTVSIGANSVRVEYDGPHASLPEVLGLLLQVDRNPQ